MKAIELFNLSLDALIVNDEETDMELFDSRRNFNGKGDHSKFLDGIVTSIWVNTIEEVIECYVLHNSWIDSEVE